MFPLITKRMGDSLEVRFQIFLQTFERFHGLALVLKGLLTEEVLPMLITFLGWLVNPIFFSVLGFMTSFSVILNGFLKWIHQSPRPSWVHDKIHNTEKGFEPDYSMPSGHAQLSTMLVTMICFRYPNVYCFSILPLLVLAIGISRVYLGIHYVHDVLYGWAVGILFALLFQYTKPEEVFIGLAIEYQFLVIFLLTVLPYLILFAIKKVVPDVDDNQKQAWLATARKNLKNPDERIFIKRRSLTTFTFPIWAVFGGGMCVIMNLHTIGIQGYLGLSTPVSGNSAVEEMTSFTLDYIRGGGYATNGRFPFEPQYMPANLWYTLHELGVTKDSLPSFTPRSLRSWFEANTTGSPYYKFQKGYEFFWKDLAALSQSMGVNIELNTEVKAVKNLGGSWRVTVKNGSSEGIADYGFDRVVMAVQATDALQFLPRDHPLFGLMQVATTGLDGGFVLLAKIKNGTVDPFASQTVPFVYVPDSLNYGTKNIDRTPCGYWSKEYTNTDVIYFGGYYANGSRSEEFFERSKTFANAYFNLQLDDVPITSEFHSFPNPFITLNPAWMQGINEQQNKAGFLVVGEIVSQAGIVNVCPFASDLID